MIRAILHTNEMSELDEVLEGQELTATEKTIASMHRKHLLERKPQKRKQPVGFKLVPLPSYMTFDRVLLSSNPHAVPFLHAYPEWIDWTALSVSYPNAKELIESNPDKADWSALSANPKAIDLLTANQDRIDWRALHQNRNGIALFTSNQDRIDWSALSTNENAIDLLTANQDRIDWRALSTNENAIALLTANQDKIDWRALSANRNAIDLLTANQDKMDWSALSANPNAIDLLTANQDKIDWSALSTNPNAIDLIIQDAIHVNRQRSNMSYKIDFSTLTSIVIDLLGDYNNTQTDGYNIVNMNYDKMNWTELSKTKYIVKFGHQIKYYDNVDWSAMSSNPHAVDFANIPYASLHKFDTRAWSMNPNPKARTMLSDRYKSNNYAAMLTSHDWRMLSMDHEAIDFLKINEHRLNWTAFSANYNIMQVMEKYLERTYVLTGDESEVAEFVHAFNKSR
jgi:hypothetical protein